MSLNGELKDFLDEFEEFDKRRHSLESHVMKEIKEIVGDYDCISVNLNVAPTYDKDNRFNITIEAEDLYNEYDLEVSREQHDQLESIFRAPAKFTEKQERVDGNLKTVSWSLTFFMKWNWGLD